MSMRIFLTSDLHLGMKFAGYPEVQVELSEARFKTLERLVTLANQNTCNLFVIAGDLFDRITVTKRDVIRAALVLKDFQGPLAAVLPGNHDFISQGQTDLWTPFKENAGDRVLVLEDKTMYPLAHYDLEGTLYAAPCSSKHSSDNAIGWIKAAPRERTVKNHIGVAHGSLQGFSPDFDDRYYPMTSQELLACGMDLWLMGHTHTQYPSQPGRTDRIFYPGTPEPDGFDCQHGGKAWVLDLSEDRSVTSLPIETGHHRFLHEEVEIRNPADVRHDPIGLGKIAVGCKGRGDDPTAQPRSLRRAQASFRVLDGQAFIGPASAPLYRDSIGFRIGFGTPVISLPHHKIKVGQKTRSPVDDFEVFFLGACNDPHTEPPG